MSTQQGILTGKTQESVLAWAAEKRVLFTVSVVSGSDWHSLRAFPIRMDAASDLLQITYPTPADHRPPVELVPGGSMGVSFRRGHKKCIFMTQIVMRRMETIGEGEPVDTLILRMPSRVREMQRRLYQRVTVPAHHFIAAKLWEGGLPQPGETGWPICAGHVSNISAGGILVDVRVDQNPRLGMGDLVGIELTVRPGQPALCAEAQYRHCVLSSPARLGLGLQFVGLEREEPGRATLGDLADLVRALRREGAIVSEDTPEA